ncbi:GlxA family transcriptional regulator [Mycolicibacterium elephantis]
MVRKVFARRRIDVLAYEGAYAAEVYGLVDILSVADSVLRVQGIVDHRVFDTRIVSVRRRQVRLANGTVVDAAAPRSSPDVVVVPGFGLVDAGDVADWMTRLDGETAFLRRRNDAGVPLASICVGTFLLAEAGALNGRRATTSWLFGAELARRYPDIDVRATSMIVEDPPVLTAGAFSASQDLALHLVRDFADEQTAHQTASVTLVSENRASQAPYVDDDLKVVQHASLADDVRRYLRHHLAEPYDLNALAATFHVSTRTLLRHFSEATGTSPQTYLQQARVWSARRLLQTSQLSVGEIAARVGYLDAATFRKHFRTFTGVTPLAFRRDAQAGRWRDRPWR